jgi:hypothetical protein
VKNRFENNLFRTIGLTRAMQSFYARTTIAATAFVVKECGKL